MIASGLLSFRACCALRLEGKSQVGIIPICVSSDGGHLCFQTEHLFNLHQQIKQYPFHHFRMLAARR